MDEQKDRLEQQGRRPKPGPYITKKKKSGIRNLPGKKKKEDSSVTLGKFMKAKVSGLEESAKKGGMQADRAFANFRRPEDAKKAALRGDFSKNIKDADYYKSIGLTGERGDKAVKDFFKPQKLAKGGRAGYKSGTRGCKLAMKGKGRAYGKNS
jgi:hypothetical protein